MKSKKLFLIITALSLVGLIIALVSQHVFNMQPCAWCVFQRLILIVCLILAGLGLVFNRCLIANKTLASLGIITGISGIISAWYQYSVASNLFSCAQTFADKFMLFTGLDRIMPWLFGIYATCADAKVFVLNIEYAVWALLLFSLITILNFINLLKK